MDTLLRGIQVPISTALAIIAVVGYVFGTIRYRIRTRRMQKDLARAQKAAAELEQVKGLILSLAAATSQPRSASPSSEAAEV